MKSLKELEEKRSALVAKGKELTAQEETRDLSETENAEVESLIAEVRDIEAQIATEKSKRTPDAIVETREAPATKKKTGEAEMPTKEQEYRALNMVIKGQTNTEEYRALEVTLGNSTTATPGNGGVTVPLTVQADVIQKASDAAPVFGLARKVTSNQGFYRFPRKTNTDKAGFAKELDNLAQVTPTLEYVDLGQKRVGAYTQVSDMILNDSAVDVVAESMNDLTADLGRSLETSILLGKGGLEFTGVSGHVDAKNVVKLVDPLNPTVEEMLDVILTLKSYYYDGAVFVVSPAVKSAITKLKDGDGQYLYFRGDTTTQWQSTFGGYPVYVSDQLEGAADQLFFGNFTKGYGMVIKNGINMNIVGDDTQSVLSGIKTLAIVGYMDGAVIDPFAFVTTAKASK